MVVCLLNVVGQRGGDGETSSSTNVSRRGSHEDEAVAKQAVVVEDSGDSLMRRSTAKMKAILRDEVLINAQKFKTQVTVCTVSSLF